MNFSFEILNGNQAGQKFKAVPGVRIGRTQCDINLQDPKVSSVHSQVRIDENKNLVLVDLNSSNGIKINNLKVKSLILTLGTEFQLGNTFVRVVGIEKKPEVQPIKNPFELIQIAAKTLETKHIAPKEVKPFNPKIRLVFTSGPQENSIYTLGYGPRHVGLHSLDIELLENNAPEISFELLPQKEGARFQTAHPDLVKLNGKSIVSENINAFDLITIGNTSIKVELIDV